MDFVINSHHSFFTPERPIGWVIPCPECGSHSVDGMVARMLRIPHQGIDTVDLVLGICSKCNCAVIDQGIGEGRTISPSPKPFERLDALPEDLEGAWEEARIALGAGAPMAASHVLRKILLHVAVEQGLPPKKENGRTPGFAECGKYLLEKGLVPQVWGDLLDLVRQIGNDAAHELPPSDSELVEAQGRFVMALLRFIYTETAAAEKTKGLLDQRTQAGSQRRTDRD